MGGRGAKSSGRTRRNGGGNASKSVKDLKGVKDELGKDGIRRLIMPDGKKIPYGKGTGKSKFFNGASREFALGQAKKYMKRKSKNFQ